MPPADLLTSAKLRLNENIRRNTPQPGCVFLRAAQGRQRMVLTPAQADLLTRYFAQPGTVSEVLVKMLQAHSCPPLSEYYELVQRAHDAGVLVVFDAPAAPAAVCDWKFRVPPKLGGIVAGVTVLLALLGLGLGLGLAPRGVPANELTNGLTGWLLSCALLSLGEALAACALAGAGCEVRWPHFHWRTLWPGFRVDSAEAVMGGRDGVRAVAALRVAPLVIGAAIGAWKMPGLLLPLLAGLLLVLAPWGGSAMAQWLHSLRAQPRFTVRSGTAYTADDIDIWADWRSWWADVENKVALGWVAWAVTWSLLLGAVILRYFPGWSARITAWLGLAPNLQSLRAVVLYALLAVLALGVLAVGRALYRHWRIKRDRVRPLRGSRAAGSPALQGGIPEMLKQLALFQTLPEEELAALAAAMTEVQVKKRQEVFRENDAGDAFYVVIEGQLEISKSAAGPKGRAMTIGWLGPGEAFGEIALLENAGRTSTIRAQQPSRLLRLMKQDFERLLLGRVGTVRVRELLQYARFLGRLVYLGDWAFDDLIRYAQRCRSVHMPVGSRVLKKGDSNFWFFLIYDGALEAREGNRVLRRMEPGDYFGEISLLANDTATADVVAVEESRCLLMGREDFLAFFSRDFRIGLRMETQASRRLGKDLFRSSAR